MLAEMGFVTAEDCFLLFHEPDGSLACVCMRCLLTVAMANDRNELERVARKHVCKLAESLIK